MAITIKPIVGTVSLFKGKGDSKPTIGTSVIKDKVHKKHVEFVTRKFALSKPGQKPKTGKPKPKNLSNTSFDFNDGPEPIIDPNKAKESKFIREENIKYASAVNTPNYISGFIAGLYFARVIIFQIVFMARDVYSLKQIERKNRELVDHIDNMIEEMRDKLQAVQLDRDLSHLKTKTLEEAYENRHKKLGD